MCRSGDMLQCCHVALLLYCSAAVKHEDLVHDAVNQYQKPPYVVVKGWRSKLVNVVSRVPQGCVLGMQLSQSISLNQDRTFVKNSENLVISRATFDTAMTWRSIFALFPELQLRGLVS